MHVFIVLAGVLLYIPFCGSYGFWDPWESHYAEVARQIRVRNDWISLWWPGSPQDRAEFWSKPVFTFWVEAFMFALFGIGGRNSPEGQMALSSAPEWAARIPMALFGILGIWAILRHCAHVLLHLAPGDDRYPLRGTDDGGALPGCARDHR
jgi:4-amino-4-deoxy-L-arabinose transferase-like glycosyltransferase